VRTNTHQPFFFLPPPFGQDFTSGKGVKMAGGGRGKEGSERQETEVEVKRE